MPRRALSEKRPFLLASIAAALAWFYLRDAPLPELYLLPVKGAAVGLLAAYAWLRHSGRDARLLAIALGLAALGDVVFQIAPAYSALVYFAAHAVALNLYLNHRRESLASSQRWAVIGLLFLTPIVVLLLSPASDFAAGLYGLALGAMAAAAWSSTFPRYRVGAGALLIMAANLLAIAGMGPLSGNPVPAVYAWPVYYLGQFLICVGIIRTLRKRDPQLRLVN